MYFVGETKSVDCLLYLLPFLFCRVVSLDGLVERWMEGPSLDEEMAASSCT